MNGMGVDRHLLGLKLIATANGFKIPDLYSDPSFKLTAHMRLSTSQVSSCVISSIFVNRFMKYCFYYLFIL